MFSTNPFEAGKNGSLGKGACPKLGGTPKSGDQILMAGTHMVEA